MGELELLLRKCIGIGLLVRLSLDGLVYQYAKEDETNPFSQLYRLEMVPTIRYAPIPHYHLLIVTVWQPVDQYPQLFAYPSNGQPPAVPNMMIVGGVRVPDGNLWERSKVDPPGTNPPVITLYAPSFHLTVPQPGGDWRNPNEVQGVSYGRH